jgi:hypothetical protein
VIRRRRCPQWCAKDHRCPAGVGREHRSAPQVWRTEYGALVATRVLRVDGRQSMELTATVALGADDVRARARAQRLAVEIDLMVRDLLGLPTVAEPPAFTALGAA